MPNNLLNYNLNYKNINAYSDVLVDNYTKLLIHFNGAQGSTGFVDECGHTLAIFGNSNISTATSKFGGSSGLFDANGDYLGAGDSDDYNLANNDFTIDFWVYFNSLSTTQFLTVQRATFSSSHAYSFYASATGKLSFAYTTTGSSAVTQTFNTVLSIQTWYHIALVRNSTTVKLYVDGVEDTAVMTIGTAVIYNSNQSLKIGGISDASQSSNAYIDEYRFSKGIARWTASFTPPIRPYSLHNLL